jgi:N-acyl-D-amino-acid deacylase
MRPSLCLCLLALLAGPAAAAAPPPVDHRGPAVRLGLSRLEKGAASYVTKRDCFSCHHQTHTLAAFASARRRGFAVPEKEFAAQLKFTLATFRG